MDKRPRWKADVRQVTLPAGRRILAISDIHGNVEFLDKLLEKVRFSPDDILFVVGDVLEKGPRSLDTLRRLMELSQTHTVYTLRGNCDQISLDFMEEVGWPDEILWQVLRAWKGRGFLMQMADEGGFPLRGPEDFPALRTFIRAHFAQELDFLRSTPTVIETQNHIFVHGGVPREDRLEELEGQPLLKNDDFLGQGLSFHKWVVVGHWPVALYHPHIPSSKPVIERERHIISIDGGNVLKVDGQLNALVIPDVDSEDFSYVAYDAMPVGVALDDQAASHDSINIRWQESAVEVLRREEEFSWCRHPASGRELWILNDYLYQREDGTHCEDSTDYRLPVKAGERLALVRRTSQGYLAKKDGTTGWYFGRVKEPEGESGGPAPGRV